MDSYTDWEVLDAPAISSNKYTYEFPLTGLDYKRSYSFQVKIVDSLMSVSSKVITVKTAPVFDWSAEDFQFNVPVYTEDGYSLTGLAKALSNTYALDTTGTTAGTNWTINEFGANLLGANLRLNYNVTRKSASGTGDVPNDTVLTAKIKHSGKIKSIHTNCVVSGGTGGLASYVIVEAANDGTYVTFKMNLAAVGTSAINTSSGAYILPVTIDTTKY